MINIHYPYFKRNKIGIHKPYGPYKLYKPYKLLGLLRFSFLRMRHLVPANGRFPSSRQHGKFRESKQTPG